MLVEDVKTKRWAGMGWDTPLSILRTCVRVEQGSSCIIFGIPRGFCRSTIEVVAHQR